ncbi:MAG: hypothetical protein EOP34_04150 [Rickettsiales bacterium]|nr:MAG: hypothetical protein EOP34_04150 [Rickettsiales bacterium]
MTIDKIRYSLAGVLVNRVKDTLCDGYLRREAGEKIMLIRNGHIIKIEQNIKLKSIPKPRNNVSSIEDRNIGVIDTETYRDVDGTMKIYALGFHTFLNEEPIMYYINEELDSTQLVIKLVNELLRDKYSKMRFYCHNLAGYDIVFLLKAIFLFNETLADTLYEEDQYKVSLTMKANKIIKCVIQQKDNKITRKLVLIDSYPILPKSLSVLAVDFNVETPKSIFPYSFALKDNLFYVGPTPSISYYSNITKDDYNNLFMVNKIRLLFI